MRQALSFSSRHRKYIVHSSFYSVRIYKKYTPVTCNSDLISLQRNLYHAVRGSGNCEVLESLSIENNT